MPGASQSESFYQIRIELDQRAVQADGASMPLRSGIILNAGVLLKHRKLYKWALEHSSGFRASGKPDHSIGRRAKLAAARA